MDENWEESCRDCDDVPTTHWDEDAYVYYCTEHALERVLKGNKTMVPYYANDESVL